MRKDPTEMMNLSVFCSCCKIFYVPSFIKRIKAINVALLLNSESFSPFFVETVKSKYLFLFNKTTEE